MQALPWEAEGGLGGRERLEVQTPLLFPRAWNHPSLQRWVSWVGKMTHRIQIALREDRTRATMVRQREDAPLSSQHSLSGESRREPKTFPVSSLAAG